jgi:hypothetical protein
LSLVLNQPPPLKQAGLIRAALFMPRHNDAMHTFLLIVNHVTAVHH